MKKATRNRRPGKVLSVLLAILMISQFTHALAAESPPEASFDIIVEALEWDYAVTAVIIDNGEEIDSATAASLTYEITALATKFSAGATTTIGDGPRTITGQYASAVKEPGYPADKGRYTVIELKYGYISRTVNDGSGYRTWLDNCAASDDGVWLTLSYSVTQIVDESEISIEYNGTIRLIYDDFELVGNPVAGFTNQKYMMYTPNGADGKMLPIVVYNHGSGETYSASKNNEHGQIVFNMGGVGWVKYAPEDCYVLVPQRSYNGYSRAGVVAFLNYLVDEGKVDPNRIYVSGSSMGGGETFSFLRENPDLFAAAIPNCPSPAPNAAQAEIIKHIPIWFVSAESDTVVRPAGIWTSYNILAGLDGVKDVRITMFPEPFGKGDPTPYYFGHFSWIPFLNNEYIEDGGIPGSAEGTTFMDWLFAQNKLSDAEDTAVHFSISGDDSVTGSINATVEYTISVQSAICFDSLEITIEADSDYLAMDSFSALSGLTAIGGFRWEPTGADNKWHGRIVLSGPALTGVNDVLRVVFSVQSDEGATEVRIVDVKAAVTEGDPPVATLLDCVIDNGAAGTVVKKYYSIYDVNKDGAVDLLDISYAMHFYMVGAGDADWVYAGACDVNGDGIVDIEDLILILANYT